jgi:uncharacterized membrane protein YhhN
MQTLLIAAAFASGLAAIASDWNHQRRPLFYVAKPLTTLLVIALAVVSLAQAPDYRGWVLAALAFCWVGDVALLFTSSRAFIVGLSSFLIGHVLFIAAFLTDLPAAPLALPGAVWLGGAAFLLAVALYAGALLPRTGRLRPAVLVYLLALTAMVLAAVLRAGLGESPLAAWALAGALLFAVSDSVLAYRKFVTAPWWGQPATLATYYLAIGLIAGTH